MAQIIHYFRREGKTARQYAIAHTGIQSNKEDLFESPQYFSEEAGRVVDFTGANGASLDKNSQVINSELRAYSKKANIGQDDGDKTDLNRYSSVVASMAGSEHSIVNEKDGRQDGSKYNYYPQ